MGYSLNFTQFSGRRHVPNGISHPTLSPYESFTTADGPPRAPAVQNDREWSRLATSRAAPPRTRRRPALRDRPGQDQQRRDEVPGAVQARLGADADEAALGCSTAQAIACGRVNHSEEVLRHPQLEARDRWRDVDSPVGPMRSLLPPPVRRGGTLRMDRIPDVGQDTERSCAALGRGEEEIDQLIAAGVVGDMRRPAQHLTKGSRT